MALLAPSSARAQGDKNLLITVLGGIGGSVDENDAGYGNTGFQLGLASEVAHDVLLGLRLGTLSYDETDRIGLLTDPSVEYVNVAGEYRFSESYYESGVFLGLGAYRLEGLLGGAQEEDTVLGLTLGATGTFDVSRRVSLAAEVAGHILDSEVAEIFLTVFAGLAIEL